MTARGGALPPGRALLLGVVLTGASAAMLVPIARCRPAELAVEVAAAAAAPGPGLALDAALPAGIAGRTERAIDGELGADPSTVGPGFHRVTWTTRYRGGFTRRVGLSQLVGPFQHPRAPSCGARLVISQALLDDGAGGPRSVAGATRALLDAQLAGLEAFPIGRFRSVESLRLRWAIAGDAGPGAGAARDLFGERPGLGYLGGEVVVGFDRARVVVGLALVPRISDGALVVDGQARAHLRFRYRVVQWAADKLPLDRLATREVERELGAALGQLLTRPPPIALPGGGEVVVEYCPGAALEIARGAWAAVPLRIRATVAATLPGPLAYDGAALPSPPTPLGATLAIDLGPSALASLGHQLWATGFLDRALAASRLVERLQDDPAVRALVSVRAEHLRLALPPVLQPDRAGRLLLHAEAGLTLRDGAATTPARLYGAIALDLVGGAPALAPHLALGPLELTCGEPPGRLTPCYGDLVAAARERAGDLHGELATRFAALMTALFEGRVVSAPGTAAALRIGTSRVAPLGPGGVRILLDAAIE